MMGVESCPGNNNDLVVLERHVIMTWVCRMDVEFLSNVLPIEGVGESGTIKLVPYVWLHVVTGEWDGCVRRRNASG